MVRIQTLSDLHAEWHDEETFLAPDDFRTDADLVLVAGDTAAAPQAIAYLDDLLPYARRIVTIGGNHEHYIRAPDYTIEQGIARMVSAAGALSDSLREIMVLEDSIATLTIRGQAIRVVGATLWTDFEIMGDRDGHIRHMIKHLVNDYGVSGVTAEETRARHLASRAFIREALETSFDGPTIVMTHHLPSARSIAPAFAGQDSNAAFASNLDDLVGMGAALWLHGHTHNSLRYRDAGGTLVLCNPLGKPHKHVAGVFDNQAFDPRLIVALEPSASGRWRAQVETSGRRPTVRPRQAALLP